MTDGQDDWTITGRCWCFGDDLNTDLMMPGAVLYDSEEAQTRALFSSHRPGWVDLVQPGDIVVAGRNFGCGSSRPAARSFVNLGIACVLADSISSLFLRGCVSYGLPALSCPGISATVQEGERLVIRPHGAGVTLCATGRTLTCEPLPATLLETMRSGGTLPMLEALGAISPPR